jgi:riboflavin kinase/FMN adenylyltransferase
MKIYHLPDMTPSDTLPSGCAAVLGFFDGVHIGHRELFRRAEELSSGRGVVAWTFFSGSRNSLLTDDVTRFRLLGDAGADYVIAEDFEDLRSLTGEEFVRNVLREKLRVLCAVCGESFRFGKDASSGAEDLLRFCREAGIGCAVVPTVVSGGEPVSSSLVRRLVSSGNVKDAALYLGRKHFYSLPVVHGKTLGRKLGFPTLNQIIPKNLVAPAPGVYACRVSFEENGEARDLPGVCNMGTCPTVNEAELEEFLKKNPGYVLPEGAVLGADALETHVIGETPDLYGKTVRVSLCVKLRDEKKFDSLEELIRAVASDRRHAEEYFAKAEE